MSGKLKLVRPENRLTKKEWINTKAQFAMFGTKHAQRIFGESELMGKVEYVPGESLEDMCLNPKKNTWMRKHIDIVADHLAQINVDHIIRGVVHGDAHSRNIIITEKNKKPFLTTIDYEDAELMSEFIERSFRNKGEDREAKQAELIREQINCLTKDVADCIYFNHEVHEDDEIEHQNFKKKVLKLIEEKINEQT